jgi:hypothetical protein
MRDTVTAPDHAPGLTASRSHAHAANGAPAPALEAPAGGAVTFAAAARALRVRRETVHRWARDGRIPVVVGTNRQGRPVRRVPVAAIEALVAEGGRGPEPAELAEAELAAGASVIAPGHAPDATGAPGHDHAANEVAELRERLAIAEVSAATEAERAAATAERLAIAEVSAATMAERAAAIAERLATAHRQAEAALERAEAPLEGPPWARRRQRRERQAAALEALRALEVATAEMSSSGLPASSATR